LKDNNLHWNQQQKNPYPDPEVPVDDAWAQMNAMLDAETSVPVRTTPKRSIIQNIFHQMLWVLPVAASLTYGTWVVFKDTKRPNDQTTFVDNRNKPGNPPVEANTLSTQKPKSYNAKTLNSQAQSSNKQPYSKPGESDNKRPSVSSNSRIENERQLKKKKNDEPVGNADKTKGNNQKRDINKKRTQGEIYNNAYSNAKSHIQNQSEDSAAPATSHNVSVINRENIQIQPATSLNDDDSIHFKSQNSETTNNTPIQLPSKPTDNIKNPAASLFNNLHYGLQWNVNIPLSEPVNYWDKAYTVLIPELWISKLYRNRHELRFGFNPYQQTNYGNKKLSELNNTADSTSTAKRIVKASGMSFGLHYNYHISPRWAAGAGFSYNLQNKVLVNYQTMHTPNDTIISNSTNSDLKSSSEWENIKASGITGNVELCYHFGKVEIGGLISVPITNALLIGGKTARPVNGSIFLRWRIK